jgi:hypothetical protein
LILTMDNPGSPIIRLRNGPLLGLLLGLRIMPYRVGITLAWVLLRQAVQVADFDILPTRAVMLCPRMAAVLLALAIGRLPGPVRAAYLEHLAWWEGLAELPSRWWSACCIAVGAVKR